MAKTLLLHLLLFSTLSAFSQIEPIDVTNQQFKLGGLQEQVFYYGFATGDKIIFSFLEADNKEVKEIEIIEYPKNQKFSTYKSKKVDNQVITVNKQGVFIFKFKNTALGSRICKMNIQRIPASESTKGFNTSVTWETKQETTYNTYTKDVLIGYDTTYVEKSKRELLSTQLNEELLFDKPQRVHSTTNANGNRTSLFFTLPKDEYSDFKTKKVVSWAYWVGVGEESNKSWQQNYQNIANLAKTASNYYTSPLGAYCVGAIADLMTPVVGEDVYYAVADMTNRDLFVSGQAYRVFDNGKGIAGYKKFTDPGMCQGTYSILLSNDNVIHGIDASVKVIAIIETNVYHEIKYRETVIKPRYEKKTFTDPVITTIKLPFTGAH